MTRPFARYSNFRLWLRALLKEWLHSATTAIIGGFGTNGAEAMAPDVLFGVQVKAHLVGLGLTWDQCVALFGIHLFWTVIRRVNEATRPGNTNPPML
jgi:hypothetical protein